MKTLTLVMWATQFGFSAVFPLCAWLICGSWLQARFGLGSWVVFCCFLLGMLTAVGAVLSSLRWMLTEMGSYDITEGERL